MYVIKNGTKGVFIEGPLHEGTSWHKIHMDQSGEPVVTYYLYHDISSMFIIALMQ